MLLLLLNSDSSLPLLFVTRLVVVGKIQHHCGPVLSLTALLNSGIISFQHFFRIIRSHCQRFLYFWCIIAVEYAQQKWTRRRHRAASSFQKTPHKIHFLVCVCMYFSRAWRDLARKSCGNADRVASGCSTLLNIQYCHRSGQLGWRNWLTY